MTDEEAKAVQETAKAARKALELTEKAGPFLEKVFGPLVEDAAGMVAEHLRYYRLKNWWWVQDKTKALLEERGVTEWRTVGAPIALPLIEAAAMEEDETLRERWAALLATAMDPNRPTVKRSFVNILENFDNLDVRILQAIYSSQIKPHEGVITELLPERIANEPNTGLPPLPPENVELSLWNLSRLGCIRPDENRGIRHVYITMLGKRLVDVCTYP